MRTCDYTRRVTIELTDEQVAAVVRAATPGGLAPMTAGINDLDVVRRLLRSPIECARCSRTTLRALLVLAAFADGAERELADIATQVELSPSTTHRYLSTWLAVGLLTQNPQSRRYRRVGPRPRRNRTSPLACRGDEQHRR